MRQDIAARKWQCLAVATQIFRSHDYGTMYGSTGFFMARQVCKHKCLVKMNDILSTFYETFCILLRCGQGR